MEGADKKTSTAAAASANENDDGNNNHEVVIIMIIVATVHANPRRHVGSEVTIVSPSSCKYLRQTDIHSRASPNARS